MNSGVNCNGNCEQMFRMLLAIFSLPKVTFWRNSIQCQQEFQAIIRIFKRLFSFGETPKILENILEKNLLKKSLEPPSFL